MQRFAEFIHRRARLVLALTLAFAGIAGGFGAGVIGSLKNGGFENPGSQSQRAGALLERITHADGQADVIALVRVAGGVNSPRGRALVARVAGLIRREPAIGRVADLLNDRNPALISRDGRATIVVGSEGPLPAGRHHERDPYRAAARRLKRELSAIPGVTVGGLELMFDQIDGQLASDLPRIEIFAFSILLLLSLVAFRGLVAAALPVLVGGFSVAGSLLILRGVAELTPVSSFALNLVTGLGLGLALDYSLFVVSRYREELAVHGHTAEALARTLATAGRTVMFSSATVTLALLSLLVFPQHILSSMGIAAALVTVMGAVAALVPLSAALAALGPRVNALAPARLQRRDAGARPVSAGPWYRLAQAVMRHAAPVAVACTVLLLGLGLPARSIVLGANDGRVLPPNAGPHKVDAALAREFAGDAANPVVVIARAPPSAGPALTHYAAALRRLPDVFDVLAPRPIGARAWRIDVISREVALTRPTQHLVGAMRALPAPYPVGVTGRAAGEYDQVSTLRAHLLEALAIITCTTLLVLFVMTESVVLPLKSLLMTLLSISAAYGILVFIFQDGRLQGLLGYTSLGRLEQTNMIILLIIIFGLSTDYGVFVLSRIKEAHDEDGDNREAVAVGLERSGRVVTAAALLFCAAIGALVVSRIVYIQEFGVGAALAVLIDATIVRALLVPSLMALLGRANWWAPAVLLRLLARTRARTRAIAP